MENLKFKTKNLFYYTLTVVIQFSFFATLQASVLNKIQRFPVADSTTYPNNTIGQINNFCTGTLIAPNKVLTAAHCIYDFESGQMLPVTTFNLGRNGILQIGVSYKVISAQPDPMYVLTGNKNNDVGILTLDLTNKPVPQQYLEYRYNPAAWLLNEEKLTFETIGSIVGYPGDKLSGTMWFVACTFELRISSILRPHYECDTFGGMSGSALLLTEYGRTYIAGVHTNGGTKNSGLLIRPDIDSFIRSKMQ